MVNVNSHLWGCKPEYVHDFTLYAHTIIIIIDRNIIDKSCLKGYAFAINLRAKIMNNIMCLALQHS